MSTLTAPPSGFPTPRPGHTAGCRTSIPTRALPSSLSFFPANLEMYRWQCGAAVAGWGRAIPAEGDGRV
ncbi:hypothetical protein RHMOL_Rhmol09G0124800 [Rhododendron molle]|uniref:Uncharacterized protein n=1 Tax=Rhododendron molle TaxID=49168 RepID=A0ACC0MDQ5_RHOML|nr:hypothetical protein RHMOL_Rhmol09G0124800 [Rhododendron molle]